jgi:hypothetical protein
VFSYLRMCSLRYVAASPEYFGDLVMWREVFGRYVSSCVSLDVSLYVLI